MDGCMKSSLWVVRKNPLDWIQRKREGMTIRAWTIDSNEYIIKTYPFTAEIIDKI